MINPGDDGFVEMDLIGEDNRIINSRMLDYRRSIGQTFLIAPLVDFNITAAVETARLVLTTRDLKHRIKALSSVDLLLMSVGNPEIYPVPDLQEPFLVRSPRERNIIQGGSVRVTGLARPLNNNPLILELIDEQMNIVGSTSIYIPPPTGDISHTPFEVTIPYQITGSTPVRLTLRQESAGRILGTVALHSLEIVLEP
jgi:hypothetical protein